MKTIFIPAKAQYRIDKKRIAELSKKLPKSIAIAYSSQYRDKAKEVKELLSKTHKIERLVQVLGCSSPDFSGAEALLVITDGKFHAISMAYETKLPVYILEDNSLKRVSDDEIKNFEKMKKASYLKFLNAEAVGILVSTKPGQENFSRALELRKNLKRKSYLFVDNNIDINEFENFGLQSWVNTACPRLDLVTTSLININDLNFDD